MPVPQAGVSANEPHVDGDVSIDLTPITRRLVAGVLGPVIAVCLVVSATAVVLDRSDDYQLRFLQRHPLGRTAITNATLTRTADADRAGNFLEPRPASVTRIWRPASTARDVLLSLDARANAIPVIRGLSRCLAVRDGDRGVAVFTWRPEPGTSAVELHGTYRTARETGRLARSTVELRRLCE